MRDKIGFDEWADKYDETVKETESASEYPFAGYKKVLGTIYEKINRYPLSSVFDVGFGTGVLASALYDTGHMIYGMDFSPKMAKKAREKMPEALLFQGDFHAGLPKALKDVKFDFAVATYSIHHLDDGDKVIFINEMLSRLNENGVMYIGDVSFENREKLEACRVRSGENWDPGEFYIVYDEFKKYFPEGKTNFTALSSCAGVTEIFK